jgi:hypothetical protein
MITQDDAKVLARRMKATFGSRVKPDKVAWVWADHLKDFDIDTPDLERLWKGFVASWTKTKSPHFADFLKFVRSRSSPKNPAVSYSSDCLLCKGSGWMPVVCPMVRGRLRFDIEDFSPSRPWRQTRVARVVLPCGCSAGDDSEGPSRKGWKDLRKEWEWYHARTEDKTYDMLLNEYHKACMRSRPPSDDSAGSVGRIVEEKGSGVGSEPLPDVPEDEIPF